MSERQQFVIALLAALLLALVVCTHRVSAGGLEQRPPLGCPAAAWPLLVAQWTGLVVWAVVGMVLVTGLLVWSEPVWRRVLGRLE